MAKVFSHRYMLALAVAAAVASPITAHAATQTWSATPADGNFSTPGNWSNGPLNATGDSLVFATSTITTLTDDFSPAPLSVVNITFNTGASALVINPDISNDSLTITGNIADNAANTEIINTNVQIAGAAQTLTLAGADTFTFGGNITGSGPLFISSSATGGIVNLSGNNSGFSGGFTVGTKTTVNANSANSIGSAALSLGGGIFANTTAGSLTFSNNLIVGTGSSITATTAGNTMNFGTLINTNGGNPTVTVTNTNLTFTGADLGTGNKTLNLNMATGLTATITGVAADHTATTGNGIGLTGAGTLILQGANTYTGVTNIAAGTVLAENATALGGNGASIVLSNNSGSSTLDLMAGTTAATGIGTNVVPANDIFYNTTINGGTVVATIKVDASTAGTAGFTQTLGTLSIGDGTTHIGTLNVLAGANITGGAPALVFGATTLNTPGTAAGHLYTQAFNPTTASLTLGSITTTAIAGVTDAAGLGGTATGNFVNGVIADGTNGAVAVTKTGTGTWTLSNANTYGTIFSSSTTVSAGTLVAANSEALGQYTSATNNTQLLLNNGGTLDLAINAGIDPYTTNVIATGGSATIASDRVTTGAGITQTLGTLYMDGATSGTKPQLNATAGPNVNNSGTATVAFGATTIGVVTDTATIITNGSASVTVSSTSGLVAGQTIVGPGIPAGTTISVVGSGVITMSQNANATGNGVAFYVLGEAGNYTSVFNPTTANLSLGTVTSGATTGATDTLSLIGSATGNQITGAISDNGISTTGKTQISSTGSATWTLMGNNTYTGSTTVSSGTLVFSGTNTTPSVVLSGTGAVYLKQGGALASATVSATGTATFGTACTTSGNTLSGGTTLSLGAGTTLNMQDATTNTLSFSSTGTLSPGDSMKLDLGASTSDMLAFTGAVTSSTSGGNHTALSFNALSNSLATGTNAYTLISGPAASVLSVANFTLPGSAITINSVPYTGQMTVNGVTYGLNLNDVIVAGTSNTLYLTVAASAVPTTYNLSAAAGSVNLLAGASTTVTSTITNAGTGSADMLNYTALTASPDVTGAAGSGGPLAQGASGNIGQTFTAPAATYGDISVSASASATNAAIGGAAIAGTNTPVVIHVGDAIADNTGTGGFSDATPLSATVTAGALLGGLSSKATSTLGSGGSALLGSTASILASTGGDATQVSMAWRTRTAAETFGNPSASGFSLYSDVVQLSFVDPAMPEYILEMDWLPTLASSHNGLYIGQLLGGNWGNAGSIFEGSQTQSQILADSLGGYGYDTTDGLLFVVTDQPGSFAVIPEPASLGLLALGGLSLLTRRRK